VARFLLYILTLITFSIGLFNAWGYFETKNLPGYSFTLSYILLALAITPVVVLFIANYKSHRLKSAVIMTLITLLWLQALIFVGARIAG
jgi:hypothetical protein